VGFSGAPRPTFHHSRDPQPATENGCCRRIDAGFALYTTRGDDLAGSTSDSPPALDLPPAQPLYCCCPPEAGPVRALLTGPVFCIFSLHSHRLICYCKAAGRPQPGKRDVRKVDAASHERPRRSSGQVTSVTTVETNRDILRNRCYRSIRRE